MNEITKVLEIGSLTKEYKVGDFSFYGFEFDGWLWLFLDNVLQFLNLTVDDVAELYDAEPDDFAVLPGGRAVIRESGFYYLALFVSTTPEAKKFSNWVFGRVLPSIFEKGYYDINEEKD